MHPVEIAFPIVPVVLQGDGVSLHGLTCGPPEGELVVLLHGFPEHSASWRRYLPALAARGYRVVAPDQRGYGLSSKPSGVMAYGLDRLTADIVHVMADLGYRQAHIVGHDWGGVVAWWLAHTRADAVRTASILNVPHPYAMRRALRFGSLSQMVRSWYILFFQIPGLPELLLARHECGALRRSLLSTSMPGTFDEAFLDELQATWQQPGALRGMVGWYRAIFRAVPEHQEKVRIDVPLLLIWGERDHALGTELIAPSMQLTTRGRVERFPDATHWVNHEKVVEVTRLLLEQFTGQADVH